MNNKDNDINARFREKESENDSKVKFSELNNLKDLDSVLDNIEQEVEKLDQSSVDQSIIDNIKNYLELFQLDDNLTFLQKILLKLGITKKPSIQGRFNNKSFSIANLLLQPFQEIIGKVLTSLGVELPKEFYHFKDLENIKNKLENILKKLESKNFPLSNVIKKLLNNTLSKVTKIIEKEVSKQVNIKTRDINKNTPSTDQERKESSRNEKQAPVEGKATIEDNKKLNEKIELKEGDKINTNEKTIEVKGKAKAHINEKKIKSSGQSKQVSNQVRDSLASMPKELGNRNKLQENSAISKENINFQPKADKVLIESSKNNKVQEVEKSQEIKVIKDKLQQFISRHNNEAPKSTSSSEYNLAENKQTVVPQSNPNSNHNHITGHHKAEISRSAEQKELEIGNKVTPSTIGVSKAGSNEINNNKPTINTAHNPVPSAESKQLEEPTKSTPVENNINKNTPVEKEALNKLDNDLNNIDNEFNTSELTADKSQKTKIEETFKSSDLEGKIGKHKIKDVSNKQTLKPVNNFGQQKSSGPDIPPK